MGHVRDLPKSQLGVDVEQGFEPKYITIRGKGAILKELRESAKKADRVFLATDPDREGEAISWHLAHALGLPIDALNRIEFHEITKDAIQRAIKEPRQLDQERVHAQQARRILDRLVGYKLSPLLWRKVRRGLSAGRVQSVAVRLVYDREAEINAFVREEYWTITAHLSRNQQAFEAEYYGPVAGQRAELIDEGAAEAAVAATGAGPFVVTAVRKRERRRNPAKPFTTSSLQQEASRKLGFTVRRTMAVAQQLYEGLDLGELGHMGLVTYIRTDSTRIAAEAAEQAAAYITEHFGADHLPEGPAKPSAARPGEQGAHEAIRPTQVHLHPDQVKGFLSADQAKLYRLIWERFVASQMAPAVFDTVSVDLTAGESLFRARGSTLKFAGFMAVYTEGRDDEEADEVGYLPELNEGDLVELSRLEPKQHFTQPPPRYTEAMLVKALEERGIGRPSTYAPIIETIQARGYVVKEEKRFVPTEVGNRVVEILKEYFPEIIDIDFTAKLEAQLDQIAEGAQGWRDLLQEFYPPFEATLKHAEEAIGGFELEDEVSDQPCEKCGRLMVIKYGRYGKFLACPGFPDCRFTKPIVEEVGVTCPKCKAHPVVERKSRKGRRFYGCAGYPECDFVSWQRPVPTPCPECGGYMVEKRTRGGVQHVCANEACGYSRAAEEMSEVSL